MTQDKVKNAVLSLNIPVRWADLDALGHVNSTRYLTYFEEARVSWLGRLGLAVEQGDTGPVIINSHANFLKPVFYPATIVIKLFVSEPGRSSFIMSYEISTAADPTTIYVDGYTKVVWVNYAENRSVPMPEVVRSSISNCYAPICYVPSVIIRA